MVNNGVPGLVNVYILLWKDPPIFHGKIHYFDWAIFNCYVPITDGYLPAISGKHGDATI